MNETQLPPAPGRPLLIGDPAPDFQCRTTMGERALSQYRGHWLVFFSHPADFTPVCTSEFVAFAKAHDDFAALGCDLLGLSVDSVFSHIAWLRSIKSQFGVEVQFPLVEDPSMAIAKAYGMIDATAANSSTVRACFIIDPAGIIRLALWYPMAIGRNVAEILRCVRALQVCDAHNVLTPANWQPGDDVILPIGLNALDEQTGADWYCQTQAMEAAA